MRVLVNGLTSKFGGVESLFLNVLRNNNTDISFDFICLDDCAANEKEFKSLGANIYYVTRFNRDRKKHKNDLNSIFSKGYDIYHLNLTRYYVPEDIIIAKKYGCKVVLHSHSSRIYKSDSLRINLLRKLEFMAFKNYCIAHSDKRIACSVSAGEYLFGKSDYDVIYNGIDYTRFSFNETNRSVIREELDISDRDFLIGHVGRFQDEKNQAFIVQMMSRLSKIDKKYKCVMVGEGPLLGHIKELLATCKLEKQIILTGNRNDVNRIYSAMDAFILPSKHEALPLCLIEAQVNGLPCIKSINMTDEVDISKIKKLDIQDNDIDLWCNYIVNNNNLQRTESSEIDTRFSIDRFITNLNDLYNEIAYK